MSKEKRFLKQLEEKRRLEKAFRLHATVGVRADFKVVDKNGRDVTKDRVNAVSN
jgi:hypothetical protein